MLHPLNHEIEFPQGNLLTNLLKKCVERLDDLIHAYHLLNKNFFLFPNDTPNDTAQYYKSETISTDEVKSHHGEECWGFNSLQLGYTL